jgi:predicted nucleic acid-binding protein
MRTPAIVDANVLVAAIDPREVHHARCAAVLRRTDLDLVVPVLVVTEVAYFVERRLGPAVEAAFLRGLVELRVEAPLPEDWLLVAAMVERYADLGLGTVDASIAVLADRLGTNLIATLDRRHFGAIRSLAGRSFRMLPDASGVREERAPYVVPTAASVVPTAPYVVPTAPSVGAGRFQLQFHPTRIRELAAPYDYPGEDRAIRDGEAARLAGAYRYADLLWLYGWKTRNRPIGRFLANEPARAEGAVRIALDPKTALDGVGYPVASCVLHFAHPDPYPILDVRALESLGYRTQRTTYSERFWQDYVAACRALAAEHGVCMRDLDRALWVWPAVADRDRYRRPPTG